jgi:hypothetical protein
MSIDLENLSGLPLTFIKQLNKLDRIFMSCEFLEDYIQIAKIRSLIIEINNFCLKNTIIGYHFTKGIARDFIKKGIVVRTGSEIRQNFIKNYFQLFTEKEQIEILQKWEQRFGQNDIENRDSCIYFNFTKEALKTGGAEPFLTYYGGEQVYFPIFEIPEIGKKLKKIGTPMILKCQLNPNEIDTSIEYPWGKIIVSSYNKFKNSNAHVTDQDGFQKVGVKPENIEIIKYTKRFR